ncbi:MAG TPA: hypothetical protein VGN57_13150 [Pirellulaceae bacterium]|jgi:hypothetical protein|nr:hypothetical protein [Pirellulaceae bacterium]
MVIRDGSGSDSEPSQVAQPQQLPLPFFTVSFSHNDHEVFANVPLPETARLRCNGRYGRIAVTITNEQERPMNEVMAQALRNCRPRIAKVLVVTFRHNDFVGGAAVDTAMYLQKLDPGIVSPINQIRIICPYRDVAT